MSVCILFVPFLKSLLNNYSLIMIITDELRKREEDG